MKTIDELITEEEDFQQYLLPGHYTVIASKELLNNRAFMLAINNCAPAIGIIRKMRHFLGHKECVHKVVRQLPAGTHLEVMIITPHQNDSVLLHSDKANYCLRHNIQLPN